jgi:hypothetical protein
MGWVRNRRSNDLAGVAGFPMPVLRRPAPQAYTKLETLEALMY